MVDENGNFKSSKIYRISKEDFVIFDEIYVKIEAQYLRFLELVGRKPDYDAYETSSLLEGRIKEVCMLCDPKTENWIKDNSFEIITYCDL